MLNSETETPFEPFFPTFPKIPRLNREIVITEKLDGTNAQIFIDDTGKNMLVGSRNRWLTAEGDNFGFCKWVNAHFDELLTLGPGRHFGEWWGSGIQRGYGLEEKRFSLFNVQRWADIKQGPLGSRFENPNQDLCPPCCSVVPVLYRGGFDEEKIREQILLLRGSGSKAAPGFMQPEGIIVYHTAARHCFKVTLEGDEAPKGAPSNE